MDCTLQHVHGMQMRADLQKIYQFTKKYNLVSIGPGLQLHILQGLCFRQKQELGDIHPATLCDDHVNVCAAAAGTLSETGHNNQSQQRNMFGAATTCTS